MLFLSGAVVEDTWTESADDELEREPLLAE
jgi:hypothetical protein